MNENDVFKIGQVVKIHGVKGKVEMAYTDDVFAYADYDYLFFRLDGLLVPFYVESYVPKGGNRALLKLEDVDDADEAKNLLDADVYFPKDMIPERERTEDSWDFLAGFKVYDINRGYVGEVTAVNTLSANTLLFVETEKGDEVMIPVDPELVKEFDEKKRELVMDLPEGLLMLNE